MAPRLVLLNSLVSFLLFPFSISISIHTITSNQSITDGDVLLSKENHFALGFFTPGNSTYRYVGIWYVKVPQKTVVWVANRDNPINDSSGVLSMDAHGNLVLNDGNRDAPLWSTNVSVSPTKSIRVAQLLDTGNLVLVEDDTNKWVWQGFDYPCNTMLSGMKIGVDLKSGLNRYLTSWKSADDPGTGEYSFKLDPRGSPQLFLYKGLTPIWRAGRWPWTGARWLGYDETAPKFFYDYIFVQNENEIYHAYNYEKSNLIQRAELDDAGVFQRLTWHDDDRQWKSFYSAPKITCDQYGECGAFSKCNPSNEGRFGCECFPGFQPNFPMDWYLRDGSGGCGRKRGVAHECGGGDGFLKVGRVKLPDTSAAKAERGWSMEACKEACLSNCSCTAYAVPIDGKESVCLTWYGELIDTVEYADVGADLYVRVDAIELENARKEKGFLRKKGMIAIPILCASVTLFLIMIIFSNSWLKKRRKARDSLLTKDELDENRRCPDLPLLCPSTIVAATNNFSSINKLGQGGFGSVYKGQLPNGQAIAVKRLSKSSGQGIEEFKNEVLSIARLQHRNLVKLLGICVEGEEKMLIYEFLPNKSLDSFIFDQTRRSPLDWRKRFEIIVGIARGILYLHQDSRLRVIHRDLKTSNILLDAEMNPKISDFGMARIFNGDGIQDNTNRIVGTYGYMSPEYAVFGRFSTKSDVFSFGVILLEIISGKKNSCYFYRDSSLTLMGHVWELWREERALDFVESSLRESNLPYNFLRCIHIGLLCVEECVEDRPSMPEVVLMLVGETNLPSPKQPAYVIRRTGNGLQTSAAGGPCSINGVTITNIEAR